MKQMWEKGLFFDMLRHSRIQWIQAITLDQAITSVL
jgi:hypothetical protein